MDQGWSQQGKPYDAGRLPAGYGDSVAAFLARKAGAKDVVALTLLFKWLERELWPVPVVPGSDDQTFAELLVRVWNDILLRLEKGSLSSADLETVGFELRRVWEFAQAYKAERTNYTAAEWVQRLISVAKSAGVPVPGL